MENHNISDLIEAYLKQILAEKEKVEIRRNDMADRFNCVPSQINYVIKTRFTVPRGYIVESKRGGGGYIRIMKVRLSDNTEMLKQLQEIVGEDLTENDALDILQQLYEHKIITKREGNLVLSMMSRSALALDEQSERVLRARLFKAFLERLRYEEKE